jgi:hypothetical protein
MIEGWSARRPLVYIFVGGRSSVPVALTVGNVVGAGGALAQDGRRIPSFVIRVSSVVGGSPRRAAAPLPPRPPGGLLEDALDVMRRGLDRNVR